jgi:outer membrane protein assembly factor BamB
MWSSPCIADGRLYIGGISGSLYCLDANTGTLVWTFSTGSGQPVYSSPTVSASRVFFAAYQALYAAPRDDPNRDGVLTPDELLWEYRFGPSTGGVNDVNCASPLALEETVIVGSVDQYFTALDQRSGKVLWRTLTPYRGQHAFSSSPALLGDRVFAATGNQSGSGRLYCFDRRSGRILWEFDIDDITFSTPLASGDRVYIANSGDWVGGNNVHRLYCLDAQGMSDGEDDGAPDGGVGGSDLVWSFDMGDYAYSSPAVSGERLYIGCCDGRLLCLNARTGGLLWVYRSPMVFREPPRGIMGSPAVADGIVFVGTADGRLVAAPEEDPDSSGVIADSELVWSYPIGGMVASSPAVAQGRVYIAGGNGRVYCFGMAPSR